MCNDVALFKWNDDGSLLVNFFIKCDFILILADLGKYEATKKYRKYLTAMALQGKPDSIIRRDDWDMLMHSNFITKN